MQLTNDAFLRAVFGAAAGWAHVAGFPDDPGRLKALGLTASWNGTKWDRWTPAGKASLDGWNGYYVVSTFEDDPIDGVARRIQPLFMAQHVVVVDDVGVKVTAAAEALLPAPSYAIETSPGNFQWGYILETPEADAGRAMALVHGLVKFPLCDGGVDPGMLGVTRYARLPVGRNTKAAYGPGGWTHRVSVWEPGRKFTLEALAAPFGIVLGVAGAAGAGTGNGLPGGRRIPIPSEAAGDEIYCWLDGWNMVQGGRTQDGGYHIDCPWEASHTVRDGTGAAYYLRGGFVCHHGHCKDVRGRRDLAEWVDARLRAESGDLVRLSNFAFAAVPDYAPPYGGASGKALVVPDAGVAGAGAGTGTGAGAVAGAALSAAEQVAVRFFDEHIYLAPEDRFYSTRTRELLGRFAVDFTWSAEMRLAGCLPVLVKATGETMPPSRYFMDEANMGRARHADAQTYWPGEGRYFRDEGIRYVNRWTPGARPMAGSGVVVTDADVGPWLELARTMTRRDGAAALEPLLDWWAMTVAAPAVKPGWHVLLQGAQGIGKDALIQPVKLGVGDRNCSSVGARGLGGQFNAWAEARLIQVNELHQTSRGAQTGADQYAILKELTENTNKTIKINEKNRREYYARNVGAYFITSNDAQALALEAGDRRFLVIMSDLKPMTLDEAVAYWGWAAAGAPLVVEWLHQRWEGMSAARRGALLGRAPMTAGKIQMIVDTEDPVMEWARSQIEGGVWPDLMTTEDLLAAGAAAARSGVCGFGFAPSRARLTAVVQALGGDRAGTGARVRVKNGHQARLLAVRDADKYLKLDPVQLAAAYISAGNHIFNDDVTQNANNVVKFRPGAVAGDKISPSGDKISLNEPDLEDMLGVKP